MADLRSLKSRVRRLAPRGAHATFQRRRNQFRHAQQRAFDRRWGVETAGLVHPAEMDVDGPSLDTANLYEATWAGSVRRMIRSLDADLATSTFIDVGSGKGPVLLYASEFPFRRVIGVEHSPELHAVAEANIARYPSLRQRCTDVTSVCQDALTFELPLEPLVLFLCNPFGYDAMVAFLDGVERSLREHPRPALIISFNPAVEDVTDGLSWLTRTGKGWSHATYRSTI